MKRMAIHLSLLAIIIAMLGSVFLMSLSTTAVQVHAQDGTTPQPEQDILVEIDKFYQAPEQATGDAEWVIRSNSFESNYPEGLTFTIEASSDKGEIVAATAYWSYVPGQQQRFPAELDDETGNFVSRWFPDDSIPPWIAINYRWQFTDSEGNTYRTAWFMGEEYADNTRHWTRAESEDIIVFVQDGVDLQVLDEIFAAMDAQRDTFRQAWGDLLSYKPRVDIFKDNETFTEWRIGFQDRPDVILAGQTSGDWGATVQNLYDGNIISLAWGTVPHEIAHLYQAEFTERAGFAGASGWWTEGQATFFELNQDYDYEQRVRNLARNGNLPVLFDGAGPNPGGNGPDDFPRFGYDVGFTFFRWLSINFGLDGHREIMDAIRNGSSRDEALQNVTGLTLPEIEMQWRQWLGASAQVPTLIPTPTLQLRLPPTQAPYQSPTP